MDKGIRGGATGGGLACAIRTWWGSVGIAIQATLSPSFWIRNCCEVETKEAQNAVKEIKDGLPLENF